MNEKTNEYTMNERKQNQQTKSTTKNEQTNKSINFLSLRRYTRFIIKLIYICYNFILEISYITLVLSFHLGLESSLRNKKLKQSGWRGVLNK